MSKRYSILLYFCFILFALLFLILSFNSRLATDDYYSIASVSKYGIINNTIITYNEWLGRYSAVFFNSVLFFFLKKHQLFYTLLPILCFLLLFVSVHRLFKQFIIREENTKQSFILILSLSFSALFFFAAIDIGETWFWYCSASTYLISISVFLLIIGIIVNQKANSAITYASLFGFAVYLGGSSELYALLFFVLLAILLFYLKKHTHKENTTRKIYFTQIILLIALVINLTAAGNQIKRSFYAEFDTGLFINYFIRMNGKLFLWFIPLKSILFIAFSSPFYLAGKKLASTKAALKFVNQQTLKRISILSILLIWFVFIVISAIIVQSGEYRVWNMISFIISAYCCYIAFYFGYNSVHSFWENLYTKTGMLCGLLNLAYHLVIQTPLSFRYANAHDQRIEYLNQLKQTIDADTLIWLPPLPPSGMLYSAEISNDTSFFTNKELKMAYDLKFHVAVEKP